MAEGSAGRVAHRDFGPEPGFGRVVGGRRAVYGELREILEK